MQKWLKYSQVKSSNMARKCFFYHYFYVVRLLYIFLYICVYANLLIHIYSLLVMPGICCMYVNMYSFGSPSGMN